MSRIFACIIFFATLFGSTQAQLVINNSVSSHDLVTKVLVGENSNLIIDSIVYKGSPLSIGSFKYHLLYNNLVSKGIIISTGKVMDAVGPNDVPNKGTESYKIGNNGDFDLHQIAKGETYDAAVLEFDFLSSTDSISFNFFFASEEYPEYINKDVNDVFGFFLIDNVLGIKTNIAFLPNTKTPISIDNVNALKNSEYFIENSVWNTQNLKYFSDHISLAELSYSLQFDGLTKPIHVGARVIPYRAYSLKLAIADVGDDIFDSAVFFEAESFKSTGKPTNKLPQELLSEIFTDNIIEFNDSITLVNYNIGFAFDSDMFADENSYSFLNKIYDILKYDKSISIEIQGHSDDVGTREYNLELSKNRAKNVMDYLISIGLERNRVTSVGFGNTKPISYTDSELNRRVEFMLYK